VRGTWRGGSFTGYPENMLNKALEMDICFHRGPAFGENGWTLPGPLRERIIFYSGEFL